MDVYVFCLKKHIENCTYRKKFTADKKQQRNKVRRFFPVETETSVKMWTHRAASLTLSALVI